MAARDDGLRLDHLVLAVHDLDGATWRYRRLGFTVTPGGRHAGSPTHNALIFLRDGSYLELLATTRPLLPPLLRAVRPRPLRDLLLSCWPPLARRFLRGLAAGPGSVDFALRAERLDAVVAAARSRGLELEGPYDMARMRPDGVRLEWRLALPRSLDLPFLIEDVTPRGLRVPGGAATEHVRGICGLSAIVVQVPDLAASAARYRALLGSEPNRSASGAGEHTATFSLGRARIHLVAEESGRSGPPLTPVLAGC